MSSEGTAVIIRQSWNFNFAMVRMINRLIRLIFFHIKRINRKSDRYIEPWRIYIYIYFISKGGTKVRSKVKRKEGKRRDLLTRWSEKLVLSDPTGPDSEWSETITCDLRSSPSLGPPNHCIQLASRPYFVLSTKCSSRLLRLTLVRSYINSLRLHPFLASQYTTRTSRS